jgi:chromosome segregation ATPase
LRQADAKRERAEKSSIQDLEAQNANNSCIVDLQDQLSTICAKISAITRQIETKAIYFDYLRSASPDVFARKMSGKEDVYEFVEEILDRHKTLSATNDQLQQRVALISNSHDALLKNHAKYMDDARETILALTTRLGNMKRELETRSQSTSTNMLTITHFAHKSTSRHAAVSLVKMAADNMYTKCKEHSRIHRAKCQANTIAQMCAVGNYLEDIRDILDAHNRFGD